MHHGQRGNSDPETPLLADRITFTVASEDFFGFIKAVWRSSSDRIVECSMIACLVASLIGK